jgi:hypothetical protein
VPPTLKSEVALGTVIPPGANHCFISSGLVQAANTLFRGAFRSLPSGGSGIDRFDVLVGEFPTDPIGVGGFSQIEQNHGRGKQDGPKKIGIIHVEKCTVLPLSPAAGS